MRARQILLESHHHPRRTLVTAVIAWRLGRSISEPVIDLTKAVEKLRRRSEQRVAVESGGELGSLGAASMPWPRAERWASPRAKRAADALQERVRAQVALESIGDGVITTDAGGYVVYESGGRRAD